MKLIQKMKIKLALNKALNKLDTPIWFVEWNTSDDKNCKTGSFKVTAPTYKKAYRKALIKINEIADTPDWVSINLSTV